MKPTINDRKAPRMKKGQFSKQVVTKELFRSFKKQYPEYKDLDWKDFFTLWEDIAMTIREQTVINPLGVKLGSYTGELKVQYLPYKTMITDRSNEEEQAFLKNINTRGKFALIKWERRWAVKFNKMLQFYGFEATRDVNRRAKAHIDANPEMVRVARNTLGGYSIWRQLKKL